MGGVKGIRLATQKTREDRKSHSLSRMTALWVGVKTSGWVMQKKQKIETGSDFPSPSGLG